MAVPHINKERLKIILAFV